MGEMEDAMAKKNSELESLRAQLAGLDPPETQKRAAVQVDELRSENSFLSAVVSRFENKTIEMQRQAEALTRKLAEADKRSEECAALQQELKAVRANSSQLEEQHKASKLRCVELEQANADALERLEEQRQARESGVLQLKDCKKDHNQRVQELLRKTQTLEKQKRDLEAANLALSEAESAASTSAESVATANATSAKELADARQLNDQLVQRLGNERLEHAQTKSTLAAALESATQEKDAHIKTKAELANVSRENEIFSIRLENLVSQLFDLTSMNDELQEELFEQRREGGR